MKPDQPISYREDEGQDRLREGASNEGSMRVIRPDLSLPIYSLFAPDDAKKVAPASLDLSNVGDPSGIAVFEDVADRFEFVAAKTEGRLRAVSGFLTPGNQHARWLRLFNSRSPKSPREEVLAARFADNAGSIAQIKNTDSEAFGSALSAIKSDSSTMADLASLGDPNDIAMELLLCRANRGEIEGLEIDIATATSVHNLGRSLNVVLTDKNGKPMNMGVGVDTPDTPVQEVSFFERGTVADFKDAYGKEPLLREYLLAHGIDGEGAITADLMRAIRDTRRVVHAAMLAEGFDFYHGETGHYSLPKSQMPSRTHAYAEATKLGYKIS